MELVRTLALSFADDGKRVKVNHLCFIEASSEVLCVISWGVNYNW